MERSKKSNTSVLQIETITTTILGSSRIVNVTTSAPDTRVPRLTLSCAAQGRGSRSSSRAKAFGLISPLSSTNKHFSTWKPWSRFVDGQDWVDVGGGGDQEGHGDGWSRVVGWRKPPAGKSQRQLWEGIRKVITGHPTCKGWERRNQTCPLSPLAMARRRTGFSIPRSHYPCADGTLSL